MWETMRAALYAARIRVTQRESRNRPSFYEFLELATIRGAETLGMQKEIGSIELSKKADLQVIDLNDPHLTPTLDITSSLVRYGSTTSVKTVIVDGNIVKEAGTITTLDAHKYLSRAQELCERTWDEMLRDQPEFKKYIR